MVEEKVEAWMPKTETILPLYPGTKFEDSEDFQNTEELEENKPKLCGICNQEADNFFDSESCDHEICVNCRFNNSAQCIFCTYTKNEATGSTNKTDITNPCYVKRKQIKKDHIIDVKEGDGTSKKQKCTVCQRVFLKTNAPYHYACATGQRPLQCTECDQTFVKKSHLQSHLNSHYGIKPFKCTAPKCKASFTQKDKLVRHMKTHSSEKHTCAVCDKAFNSLSTMIFHMERVHSSVKPYKCDLCPRTYKYQRTLTVHRLKHQELKDHLCEVCGKRYAVAAQLKLHKRSHLPVSRRPFKCRRRCKQRFITRHDKTRHELTHDLTSSPDFECSICKTTFRRKDNLERHMKNFHQEPLNLQKTVKLTAVVSPLNLSTVENKISNNLNKPNKCGKKKHKKLSNACTKEKNTDELLKKHVKVEDEKHFIHPLGVCNTFKQLDIVYTKKSSQPETVSDRPTVIRTVSGPLSLKVLKVGDKQENNVTNLSLTSRNVIINCPNINTSDTIIDNKLNKPPKGQVETKIVQGNDVSRSFKIICHTNSLMTDNLINNSCKPTESDAK